jgi:hypothetical protein
MFKSLGLGAGTRVYPNGKNTQRRHPAMVPLFSNLRAN